MANVGDEDDGDNDDDDDDDGTAQSCCCADRGSCGGGVGSGVACPWFWEGGIAHTPSLLAQARTRSSHEYDGTEGSVLSIDSGDNGSFHRGE